MISAVSPGQRTLWLPGRVPRVPHCVAIFQSLINAGCKVAMKKDYKAPIKDRKQIHTCSPIAAPGRCTLKASLPPLQVLKVWRLPFASAVHATHGCASNLNTDVGHSWQRAVVCLVMARYAHRSEQELVLVASLWFSLRFVCCFFVLVLRLSVLCRAVVCASVQASTNGLCCYRGGNGKNNSVCTAGRRSWACRSTPTPTSKTTS